MTPKKKNQTVQAWIISVDMGYGHQRAAYPLKDIAYERMITANNDKIISVKEKKLWNRTRQFYEFVSRLSHVPIIGPLTFGVYDSFQKISPLFPYRNLSKPNWSVRLLKRMILRGLCASLIDYTSKNDLPVVTTHFIPALAYHYHGREVYCVVTDSDVNRIWVPDNPQTGKITYFSPGKHATLRLTEYGVPPERIVETGFPLPKENVGVQSELCKHDLLARLVNLDPKKVFFEKYKGMIQDKLLPGKKLDIEKVSKYHTHPLTITFMVGGAGVQKEIAIDILTSFREEIEKGNIRINLVAGTKIEIKEFFEKEIQKQNLQTITPVVQIIFALDKRTYFEKINAALRTTDILWTKPSEMSFYTGLGIPLIMCTPIGDHENFNREWILHIGSGIDQKDPAFTKEWLNYWIEEGRLADCAIQGFIDAPAQGTYHIENYLRQKNVKK